MRMSAAITRGSRETAQNSSPRADERPLILHLQPQQRDGACGVPMQVALVIQEIGLTASLGRRSCPGAMQGGRRHRHCLRHQRFFGPVGYKR